MRSIGGNIRREPAFVAALADRPAIRGILIRSHHIMRAFMSPPPQPEPRLQSFEIGRVEIDEPVARESDVRNARVEDDRNIAASRRDAVNAEGAGLEALDHGRRCS